MSTIKLFTAVLIMTSSVSAFAEDDAGVTPYRPSVSSPAQLPVAGQLELEYGGLFSKTDGTRRNSLPYLLKLAFNKEWGILFGGEAYISQKDDVSGIRARGLGDTNLVLKRAFIMNDTTAFGLELGAKIPTAKDSLGSGKADYSINSIFSKDISKVHMDTNLNLTRFGAIDVGTARTQTGLSSSFSIPVTEKWGATAELSGTHRNGAANTAQFLTAATFSPSKRLTIDIGVARGLTSASPDWSLFTGVVMPIAKLW
ncbi:MAG: transporter [Burkholderiaceae bacterium]